MPWPAVVFGWPAVIAALAAYGCAFLTTRASLGFLGALIATPFCVFVSGYPMFHWAGPVALGANFLSAFVLYRGRRDVAFTVLLPFLAVVTLLAVFALRDITLVRG